MLASGGSFLGADSASLGSCSITLARVRCDEARVLWLVQKQEISEPLTLWLTEPVGKNLAEGRDCARHVEKL